MRHLKDEMHSQVRANTIDYQVSVTLKKIQNLDLDEKIRAKIELLIHDLAIILREDYLPNDDQELMRILKDIQDTSMEVIKIIKDTMLSLRFRVRFDIKDESTRDTTE